MLNLVPLAGPGRKMTDRDREADLIGKRLQREFPQAQTPAVAAAAVGRDQDPGGGGIELPAFGAPPPANRGYRERPGVVIGADGDKARVATDVVHSIRIRPRYLGGRKVMRPHTVWLLGAPPLPAGILEVPDELLFLGVDRDHRPALRRTAALMCRNCASRSGWSRPSSVFRLLWRL